MGDAGAQRRLHRLPERAPRKKLKEAALHWARGGGDAGEEVLADLKEWGAPPEVIEAQREQTDDLFELHTDAWPTMRLFAACGRQWRTAGITGIPVGLDYVALKHVAEWLGVKLTKRRFAEIREMEAAVLAQWARQREFNG